MTLAVRPFFSIQARVSVLECVGALSCWKRISGGELVDIIFDESEDLVTVLSSVDIAPFLLLLPFVFAFGDENRLALLINSQYGGFLPEEIGTLLATVNASPEHPAYIN